MEKICIKCKIEVQRPHNSYCKSCHNEYQKALYKRKPQATQESKARRKKAIRDLILEAKNVPCADCDTFYPYYVMDFDHLSDKKFNISEAARHYTSLETVISEIEKCEVVCANCHRIRTYERSNTDAQ